MKAIMISIKPKWVAKILNGEKTIEIRKTMPKCDLPIDVYIYCTKDKKGIFKERHNGYILLNQNKWIQSEMSGKVVAKFTLNKVEEIPTRKFSVYTYPYTETLDDYDLLDKSCLFTNELENYLGNKIGYAWHISNLEIFDKPKELSEFFAPFYYKGVDKPFINAESKSLCHKVIIDGRIEYESVARITKAPQSWFYVEE